MRIVIAAVLVLVALFLLQDHPYLRTILALFGAVLAGTAYLHSCWLYTLMDKNTCEPDAAPTPAPEQTSPAEGAEESSGEKIG